MGEAAGVTFMQGVGGASTLVLDALLQVSMGDNKAYLDAVTGGMLGGGGGGGGGGQQQQQQTSSSGVTRTCTYILIHI